MKKLIIILLTLALAGTAFYLVTSDKSSGNLSKQVSNDRLFKVEDVDQISRIVIDRPKYPEIVLYRNGSDWKMNNEMMVNKYVISDVLGLLGNIEVDYIPTKAMTEQIFKDLEKNGIRYRIYDQNDDLIRDFQVATETANGKGTPFVVTGEKQPYILRIRGFEGSLRTRINKRINDFRTKDVFNYDINEIESIQISYDRSPSSSFTLTNNKGTFSLRRPGESSTTEINQKTAAAYFTNFEEVVAEANDSENPKRQEIINGQRFAQIIVTTSNQEKRVVDFYSYADISVNYETKDPTNIHPDNKFFAETNDNQMVVVQQKIMKYIWQPYSYFL